MRDQYMRSSDGFMVVYDVTSQPSLQEAAEIVRYTRSVCDDLSVPIVRPWPDHRGLVGALPGLRPTGTRRAAVALRGSAARARALALLCC